VCDVDGDTLFPLGSEAIHQRIAQAQQQGWARYLGFAASEDLPLLYAGARPPYAPRGPRALRALAELEARFAL
jgi:hypothetical protein